MNTIPIKSQFLSNSKLRSHNYFPLQVRVSAKERVKRHSLYFAGFNALFSIGYHLIPLNWKYALTQTAKSFLHKGIIGVIFFYTNEVIWSWLHKQKTLKQENNRIQNMNSNYRISAWSTYLFSSFLLLPVFIGINLIYKLPTRKTLMKSIVDGLLLSCFGLFCEQIIRNDRKLLIEGQLKDKIRYFNLNE